MEITLAKALKLRKVIRARLDNFPWNNITYIVKDGDTEVEAPKNAIPADNEDGEKSCSFTELVEWRNNIHRIFAELNTAIDIANTTPGLKVNNEAYSVRRVLNELEALKMDKLFYENIAKKTEKFVPVAKTWDNYQFNTDTKTLGAYKTVVYENAANDIPVKSKLSSITKKVRELEDTLSELNTLVKISIDDKDFAAISVI